VPEHLNFSSFKIPVKTFDKRFVNNQASPKSHDRRILGKLEF